MVMQSYLAADTDDCEHLLGSLNFLDGCGQSPQGSDPSFQECANWMAANDGSANWGEPWAGDTSWQGGALAPDWSAAWGDYQQQQWTAAFMSSQQSWAGLDPMALLPLATEVHTKLPKEAPAASYLLADASGATPWTEMSLDPEKPTTPANKSRAVARTSSDVKLPPPVGSGRNIGIRQDATESLKLLPLAGNDGGQSWRGMPVKLSLSSSSLPYQAAEPDQMDDPIARLAAQMIAVGTLPSPSMLQPAAVAQKAKSLNWRSQQPKLTSQRLDVTPLCGGPSQLTSGGCTAESTPSSGSSTADTAAPGMQCASSTTEAADADSNLPISTVMVRNVPSSVKQSGFVKELEDSGFGGLFDFCYLPSAFDTGKNKGYAFVNFINFVAYSAFLKAWHGSRRFSARAADPALNVSAAALQGLERNIEKWDAPRMRRVRNPEYRPFVVKNGRTDLMMATAFTGKAPGPPTPPSVDEAASHREFASALELPSGLLPPAPPGLARPQGGYENMEIAPPGLSFGPALLL